MTEIAGAYQYYGERGQLLMPQLQRLVQAIDPSFIENKQGKSYIAQHEARAEMTRIFGFGNWDSRVLVMEQIYEERVDPGAYNYPKSADGKKPYFIVGYRAAVEVRIRSLKGEPIAEFIEWHAEENAPLPNRGEAHAFALTSCESYALRRALIGLGDRLGLGLYAGGSDAPLVKTSVQLQIISARQQAAQGAPKAAGSPTVTSPEVTARPAAAGAIADAFRKEPTDG